MVMGVLAVDPRREAVRSSRLIAMAITKDELIRILAEADPVGLIAGGAPQDEYAAEAEAILALHGVPKLTEITGVFAVSFSNPGACRRDTARWIAEEMTRRADR
jgi:hypothetical protein